MTDQTPPNKGHPPEYTTAAARTALDMEVTAFFDDALSHLDTPSGKAPALALRVSPGLGKTRAALRHIAQRGRHLLTHGHVVVVTPTLDLAEQAARDFGQLAPGLASTVVRGRDASDAEGRPMCVRAEVAKKISGIVPSVTQALCRTKRDGKIVAAPCATGCPYLAQLDLRRPHVLFTSHAYLPTRVPVAGPVALFVIDEKVWPTLAGMRRIAVSEWLASPADGLSDAHRRAHEMARSAVYHALEAGRPVPAELRAHGFTPDLLKALAHHEETTVPGLTLDPALDHDELRTRIADFDRRSWAARVGRARVFHYLAGVVEGVTAERLTLSRDDREGGELCLHGCRRLGEETPMLFLDADADDKILQAIRPETTLKSIEVLPRADVVQAVDNTLSNAAAIHPRSGRRLRENIAAVVARESAAAPEATLLVATRRVLAALQNDVLGRPPENDRDLVQPLHGATPRWFGPRMLGLNAYERYSTVVLVGRLQPPVGAVEDLARSLFGDDGDGLEFLESDAFVETETMRTMRGDAHVPARLRDHPDPRASHILHQLREAQSLQALARLRLTAPDRPKRVVIVGSLPLPGLPVSRLTTLSALGEGLEEEPDILGYRRLATLLGEGATPRLRGLRLSPAGLQADAPGSFSTLAAAKRFRRGRDAPAIRALLTRLAHRRGWPVSFFLLEAVGGGRPVPAVTFEPAPAAERVARSLWPDRTPRRW